ncbi:hypothetical protein [Nonomuraea turkmeniaca]|uniref:hypothetical protein n=1 Tax=Nonomuraea turkmeniaca TaxID=103838 RepID=UPI001B85B7C2|nr:hypothetical protein [Nonomuraea turkmeniaca]
MTWHSYRACWAGTDYEATPDLYEGQVWMRLRSKVPAEGFEQVEHGLYVHAVPAGECMAITFVTTVCQWQGEPFQVHGQRDDKLLIEYTGGRTTVALRLGLERVERGVYRQWVLRDEVSDLTEHISVLGNLPSSQPSRAAQTRHPPAPDLTVDEVRKACDARALSAGFGSRKDHWRWSDASTLVVETPAFGRRRFHFEIGQVGNHRLARTEEYPGGAHLVRLAPWVAPDQVARLVIHEISGTFQDVAARQAYASGRHDGASTRDAASRIEHSVRPHRLGEAAAGAGEIERRLNWGRSDSMS